MRLHTFTSFSRLLHIMFIWFLHVWARDPDLGSQSHVVSYSRSYFFTFFSYSVKTSFSSSSIRIVFTTLVFAIHFPGMKNKRGGPIFHSMENTQFCFFQVEGWPQVLDVSWSRNCPNVFRFAEIHRGVSLPRGSEAHTPGVWGVSGICYAFPWNEKWEGGVLFFIPWKTRSCVFSVCGMALSAWCVNGIVTVPGFGAGYEYFSLGDAMCEHADSARVFELANQSSVETCQPTH